MNAHRSMVAVRPNAAGIRRHQVLRLPAFWLLMALLGAGTWQVGGMLRTGLLAYPRATLLGAALFGLYAVPFVLVVRSLDYFEREPPLLLLAAFGWGGLISTATAV